MSRIAVLSRSSICANGIIEALRQESQVFSYLNINHYKIDYISENISELRFSDCIIFCIDFKRDFQILDQVNWLYPEFNLIIFSPLNHAMLERFALKYKAKAVLCASIEKDEFVRCVERIYLADKAETLSIVRTNGNVIDERGNYGLTNREVEILNLISQSLSNKEIAKQLYISDHTVSVHRKNLMKKLQVNNAAGLISKAFRENLIEL